MWTAKRRAEAEARESKVRDRLRRLIDLEQAVMESDPREVEARIRQMQYGHRVRA